MRAGCSIRLSTPPSEGPMRGMVQRSMKRLVVASSPRIEEADDAAVAAHVGAGDRVVGVVGEAGVVDALDGGVGGEELGDALAGGVLAAGRGARGS
jgi:hypothetical protein